MNPDSCPEVLPAWPKLIKAWETSDSRLFTEADAAAAEEHESRLRETAKQAQLLRDYISRRLSLGGPAVAELGQLRRWLKNNPELVERLMS